MLLWVVKRFRVAFEICNTPRCSRIPSVTWRPRFAKVPEEHALKLQNEHCLKWLKDWYSQLEKANLPFAKRRCHWPKMNRLFCISFMSFELKSISKKSLQFSKPCHMFYGLICIGQKPTLFSFFLRIFVSNLRTGLACMMVFSSSSDEHSCFMTLQWL